MLWAGLVAIANAIGKVIDFLNLWSARWVNKLNQKDSKSDAAQLKMDEAEKKGDTDAFLNARADKHSAD